MIRSIIASLLIIISLNVQSQNWDNADAIVSKYLKLNTFKELSNYDFQISKAMDSSKQKAQKISKVTDSIFYYEIQFSKFTLSALAFYEGDHYRYEGVKIYNQYGEILRRVVKFRSYPKRIEIGKEEANLTLIDNIAKRFEKLRRQYENNIIISNKPPKSKRKRSS